MFEFLVGVNVAAIIDAALILYLLMSGAYYYGKWVQATEEIGEEIYNDERLHCLGDSDADPCGIGKNS